MSLESLTREVDALATLLEAKTGLRHPSHAATIKRARAKVQRVLRQYFTRQRDALLREIRPKMHQALAMFPPAVKEAKSNPGRRFSHNLLPDSLQPLSFPVTAGENLDFQDAITAAIAGAAATLAAEAGSSATLSPDFASRYLRENSLTKLTGGFSDTSIERLRDAVATAWDEGGSAEQIVKAIQDTFEDFSDARAEMIAQTEVNDAYIAGLDDVAHQIGFEKKAWTADGTDACDECQEQIDAGWIGIDEDFPGGDDPPLHPNCDCGVDYRMGTTED